MSQPCFLLPDEKPLSSVLKNSQGQSFPGHAGDIDGLYTQRFNRHHKRDGSLFRGRYKAVLVDKDEYLAQVVRYINLNPVQDRSGETARGISLEQS